MQFVPFVLAALIASSVATQAKKPENKPLPAAAAKAGADIAALKNVAVVGASMSAGFGLDPAANPLMGQASSIQLAHIVDASIRAKHEPVHNSASFMFFAAPPDTAKQIVEEAVASGASALVAIDYLFWLGYGVQSDADRTSELETGLAALESFTGPILLGDLPDFGGASVDPMMLPKAGIPSSAALKTMNERIGAWAKTHKNVVLVPLSDALTKLLSDEEIKIGPNKFAKGSKTRVMQRDNLHPTLEGTCAVWALAVEAWTKADPKIPASAFELDVAKLAAAAKPGRAKAPEPEHTGTGVPAKKSN